MCVSYVADRSVDGEREVEGVSGRVLDLVVARKDEHADDGEEVHVNGEQNEDTTQIRTRTLMKTKAEFVLSLLLLALLL